MPNRNAEKKKQAEAILAKYLEKLELLKRQKNSLITRFAESLKEKRIEEIKQSLKKL